MTWRSSDFESSAAAVVSLNRVLGANEATPVSRTGTTQPLSDT